MGSGLRIAFFGSSLVSTWWNGAASYYRGIIRALHERGHSVTFYEPDAFGRQEHRDIADPDWAKVVVYPSEGADGVQRALDAARGSDLVIKASGIGVFDEWLEQAVLDLQQPGTVVAYWDVEAPATLHRLALNPDDPFRALVFKYDLILTFGGGHAVAKAYRAYGARICVPIYNALDPSVHGPAPADDRFRADLAFLGNRLPDRETRVEQLFFDPAARLPQRRFLLGGDGWEQKALPPNVRCLGHVHTPDHNAFNSTPLAVLSVCRERAARTGYAPPARVFEAAGAGACVITDDWDGIDLFFEPGREILVARDGGEVASILQSLTPERAARVGMAAHNRARAEHTYAHRAAQLEGLLDATRAYVGRIP